MDLSQWYNLAPNLQVNYTKKKFYKKYLYRLNYFLPSAYLLRVFGDITDLDNRMEKYYSKSELTNYHKIKLRTFASVIYSGQVKRIRIERGNFAIFGETLEELYELANGPLGNYTKDIVELCTVRNQEELDALNNNFIIMREPTDYTHRVTLRQGYTGNLSDRQSLGRYLEGIGSEIKITKNLLSNLVGTNKYLQGGYFYVRDTNIVNMVMLIMPRIVLSVDPLVVKPNQ